MLKVLSDSERVALAQASTATSTAPTSLPEEYLAVRYSVLLAIFGESPGRMVRVKENKNFRLLAGRTWDEAPGPPTELRIQRTTTLLNEAKEE